MKTSVSSELCLQNRSWFKKVQYDHVSEALKSLKWLNVRDKLLFNDLVMRYKCLKNLTPGYLRGRFNIVQTLTKETLDRIMTSYAASV